MILTNQIPPVIEYPDASQTWRLVRSQTKHCQRRFDWWTRCVGHHVLDVLQIYETIAF